VNKIGATYFENELILSTVISSAQENKLKSTMLNRKKCPYLGAINPLILSELSKNMN
jgi:hypothetical protein